MAESDGEFVAFMRDCGQRLFRVAYLLTGDRSRAEDLTQEALARTYLAWPRVRHDDAYPYARRVLVNLRTDWWRLRRFSRERSVDTVPELPDRADVADTTVHRGAIVDALRRLTARERTVIVYRYFLDLTEQQAAVELGLAVGTVKSTTARALAKLRVSPDLSGAMRDGGS